MTTRDSTASYLGSGGRMRGVVIPNPPAGVEIDAVVPADLEWRLHTASWLFLTSAVGGGRIPSVTMIVGGVIAFGASFAVSQLATVTVPLRYSLSSRFGQVSAAIFGIGGFALPWPTPRMEAGDSVFRTSTLNLDAADQFSEIQLLVEEFQPPE